MKEPVFQEIQDGLQLLVIYKEVPTPEEMKKQLPNFHSRIERPTGKDSTLTAYVLLFTDLKSFEAAKKSNLIKIRMWKPLTTWA